MLQFLVLAPLKKRRDWKHHWRVSQSVRAAGAVGVVGVVGVAVVAVAVQGSQFCIHVACGKEGGGNKRRWSAAGKHDC